MDKAKEIAGKLDIGHFNRKLVDSTEAFLKLLNEEKKGLTKGNLINLLRYIVKYPDTEDFGMSKSVQELARLGAEQKDALVATTVQVLIEEGQRQAAPKFKPTEEGE